MTFKSEWLTWKSGCVGSVGDSDVHVQNSNSSKRDDFLHMPSDKTKLTCKQGTDKTDNSPPKSLIIDGHKVALVIWELPHGVIFADECGLLWRYLESFKAAWPVIVSEGIQ